MNTGRFDKLFDKRVLLFWSGSYQSPHKLPERNFFLKLDWHRLWRWFALLCSMKQGSFPRNFGIRINKLLPRHCRSRTLPLAPLVSSMACHEAGAAGWNNTAQYKVGCCFQPSHHYDCFSPPQYCHRMHNLAVTNRHKTALLLKWPGLCNPDEITWAGQIQFVGCWMPIPSAGCSWCSRYRAPCLVVVWRFEMVIWEIPWVNDCLQVQGLDWMTREGLSTIVCKYS